MGRQKWHNNTGLLKDPWNKGEKETRPEVIDKLKKAHIGKIPWNKGITYNNIKIFNISFKE